MSAALRLKRLIFIVAALALVSLGLVAAFSSASPARATVPEPCVPTEDEVVTQWFETDPGDPWVATGESRVKTEGTDATYSDWVDEGAPVRTETNVAPSAVGDLVQYVSAGTVDDSTDDHWDNTVVTFYTWTGGNSSDAPPVYADGTQTSLHPDWNATSGSPQGGPHASAPLYSPYEVGGGPNTASWFLKAGNFVPGVTDTDYLWQKQVRTVVPGTDDVIEYEYTKTIEGVDCPPVDNGKKVVVCKYVGTPPGTPHEIIVVSVSTLPGFDPETSTFPFPFGDAQDSIAIRYAIGNEQPGDAELVNCPGYDPGPVLCPQDSDHPGMEVLEGESVEEVCYDEDPVLCPEDSDHPGMEVLEGESVEEVCYDEDPVLCPEDSDHPGMEVLEGESVEEVCYDEDPVLCPEDSDHPGMEVLEGESVEEVCYDDVDPGPVTCPEGSEKAGDEIPEGEDPEEFCADDDDEEVCPEGTDHAGEEVAHGEDPETFCDDDDIDPGPTCKDDPTLPGCDENTPGSPSNPSNGPTVKGAQATAPTAVVGASAGAGTPATQVPSAINAGLGSSEPSGNDGNLGLLGVATALLGAAMVGLTVRPRRRTGATARART